MKRTNVPEVLVTPQCLDFISEWVTIHDLHGTLPPVSLREYDLLCLRNDGVSVPLYQIRDNTYCDKENWGFAFGGTKNDSTVCEMTYLDYDGKQHKTTLIIYADGQSIKATAMDAKGQDVDLPNNKAALYALRAHTEIMRFFANFQPEILEHTEKSVTTEQRKGRKSKRRLTRTSIKLYRFATSEVLGAKKNKCPYRFIVRGHYRHYKSGKIVFIAPYEKNKKAPFKKKTRYTIPSKGGATA